jgi:hypothetical protein
LKKLQLLKRLLLLKKLQRSEEPSAEAEGETGEETSEDEK